MNRQEMREAKIRYRYGRGSSCSSAKTHKPELFSEVGFDQR